jgi:nucleoside-diphosphate-sugar epimerase
MKKVLVTGAAGFIGRQCLQQLVERGFEVHGIFSSSSNCEIPNVQMHKLDLLEGQYVDELIKKVRPSHLLHLAWVTTPGILWNSPDNHRWAEASLGLAHMFKDQGGQRAVFAGTCAEYDWSYGICSELNTPLNPTTLYGSCKKELFENLKMMDFSCAWGRVFHLYGPYEPQKKLTASVILALLRGENALCSYGNQERDFLHVQDVARAFVTLLECSLQGAVNIGSGSPVKLKSLCLKIGEKLGMSERLIFGAIPAPKDDPGLLVADVKRLYEELQWRPIWDLDTGLDQTIQWWKEHLAQVGV